MNAREVMQALLEGKKITPTEWKGGYVQMMEDKIVIETGEEHTLDFNEGFKGWKLYGEPKQKRRLYQALLKDEKNRYWLSGGLFESIEVAQEEWNTQQVIKLIEPAIEVDE